MIAIEFVLWLTLFSANGAVNPGCLCIIFSETFGKDFGRFHSPDFPRAYPQRVDCLLYSFLAKPHEIIELAFSDFDVPKTNIDCFRGDYVKLFLHLDRVEVNEYTPWDSLLCGSRAEVPVVLYSSGSAVMLEFHSEEGLINGAGFRGTFRFIDKRLFQNDGQKLVGTNCDHQFLSSDLSASSGRFYSPRYPATYPKNIRCSYRFIARLKERIKIVFEEVALQKGDLSCLNRADMIKVFDGRNSRASTIHVICNEGTELEVLSTGQDLVVEFTANSEEPSQGFKAKYQFQGLHEYDSYHLMDSTGGLYTAANSGKGVPTISLSPT